MISGKFVHCIVDRNIVLFCLGMYDVMNFLIVECTIWNLDMLLKLNLPLMLLWFRMALVLSQECSEPSFPEQCTLLKSLYASLGYKVAKRIYHAMKFLQRLKKSTKFKAGRFRVWCWRSRSLEFSHLFSGAAATPIAVLKKVISCIRLQE